MQVDSSGEVGIGTTSPGTYNADGRNLVVGGNAANTGITIASSSATGLGKLFFAREDPATGSNNRKGLIAYEHQNEAFTFHTGVDERMRLDASGHLGLGVTPSAWPTNADSKALQIGTGFAAFGRGSGDEDRGGIAVNYYTDGTDNKYIANGHANRIYMADGNIDFQYAASGSAGNNLTFTSGIRMLADGKVGIGTTSPSYDLQVNGSNTTINIAGTGWSQLYLTGGGSENYITSDDQLSFHVGGSERIVFKSTGQLLVGHDTVIGHNGVDGYLQVTGTGTDDSSINLNRFSADNWCPFLSFGKSRNATKGSHTKVENNDYLAYINFAASDGENFNNTAAFIAVKVDGTTATDTTPARIEFATSPTGSNSAITRTTIDNAGATLFSGLTGNTDTRNVKGIVLKSPAGISFQNYGANGSRNWRIRPDDLGGWADLDFSCAPTDGSTDIPNEATDNVLSLQGDTKDVKVVNGNLVIGTAGKGIDFSAQTQSAATGANASTSPDEVLDHYESGTWTPVLKQGGTNVITTTMTNAGSAATYTRIGNLVQLSLCLNNETTAGNTGVSFAIQGLPFAASSNERQVMSGGLWYSTGLRLNAYPTMCHIGGGAAEINFYGKDSASGIYYTAEVSSVGSGTYFFVSIVYLSLIHI